VGVEEGGEEVHMQSSQAVAKEVTEKRKEE
jgi:hypothetical protein